ncbi:DNA-binding protein [Arthrobacter wenxiniae]|uniref:KfrA protein n=1 Tax=Arthrobacter wenxiniae TaxID=2713570 RepID=A0A7Y7M0V0_9MICC|nr:DNA-binding protein [Arthrobacter wenxiniae]NVM96071.1 KfrA protein [Arthrobacter wenxiniae]
MADASSKSRVYAAADKISAERSPTISTVRELAGVSNADATRYLKEWRDDRLAAAGKIAAAPPSVTELAARMAGTVWAEAAAAADARHAEVEKAWSGERDNKDREIQELARELDRLTAELKSEKESALRRLDECAATAEGRAREITALAAELAAATAAANSLTTDLATARATVDTLRATQDALIARISPESPATPEEAVTDS